MNNEKEHLHLKVTREEKQKIMRKAKERGVDMTTLIKEKVLEENSSAL